MKLIFWTKPPFRAGLDNAVQNAREKRFVDWSANRTMMQEGIKYCLDLYHFTVMGVKELLVNLSNGLLSKRAAFYKHIEVQQSLHGRSSEKIDVAGIILHVLDTKFNVRGEEAQLHQVLTRGRPAIIIANHPYAPIDGLMLMSLIHKFRTDYALSVNGNNGLISLCPDFNFRLIPVDLSEGLLRTANPQVARASRVKAFRLSLRLLRDTGKCLVMFPSGNISKAMNWGETIQDTKWLNGVGLLVREFAERGQDLVIVPVFINTHMGGEENSSRYQRAFLDRKTNVSASLMHAFFNPPPSIDLHIGRPLTAADFKGDSKDIITSKLRSIVYELAPHLPIANREAGKRRYFATFDNSATSNSD